MKEAGIRELKAHLSRYLRDVQAGETVLVTDRGQVIAEIRRPEPMNAGDRWYREMVAKGTIRPAANPGAQPWLEWKGLGLPDGTAQELLDWVRGE